MIEEVTENCPYCGEPIDLLLDLSAGDSRYVEDCQVCCQPMIVRYTVNQACELEQVSLTRENE